MSIDEKTRIVCTGCNSGIRVRSELIGRRINCPRCQAVNVVAEPADLDHESTFEPAGDDSTGDNRDVKFCHYCGKTIARLAEICPKCGVRQEVVRMQAAHGGHDNRKLTASLLAILLGTFGVHWFYLGDQRKGLIYLICTVPGVLLLFPTLIIAVLSFVDGVKMIGMTTLEFNAKFPPR